jgi:glycosyltransferase involved in cell wall biosynthesis
MKVCLFNLTTTTQIGGVETYVWEVASRLPSLDVDVDIIAGRGTIVHELPPRVCLRQFWFLPRVWLRRVPLINRSKTLTKLLERLSFGMVALPTLLRFRYDIIHIMKPYDLPITIVAKVLRGSKLLLGCHGTDFYAGDRLFTRWVDGAVSCSRFNAGQIVQHYHLSPIVVFNGFDPVIFHPIPKDAELKSRFASPSDTLLLFVGRLVKWKGVMYLLDALAMLDGTVKLVVGGEGEERAQLERHAVTLGIADRVFFVGGVDKIALPAYYAISDLVVLPSLEHETFSIVACEAQGCERPVIGTNVGGIQELVEERVPPADAKALAEKIQALLADPPRRAEIAARGRASVMTFLTWEASAARLFEVYKRLNSGERAFEPHTGLAPAGRES